MAREKSLKFDARSRQDSLATSHDPLVSNLFASSLGPSKPVIKSTIRALRHGNPNRPKDTSAVSARDSPLAEKNVGDTLGNGSSDPSTVSNTSATKASSVPKRRRKRDREEDDIEGAYMQRLAEEDSNDKREVERSRKRQRLQADSHKDERETNPEEAGTKTSASDADDNDELEEEEGMNNAADELPKHESLTSSTDALELDKAARTVFLANVSTSSIKSKAAKKTLLSHLTSFCSELAMTDQAQKVESLRFRSTPFPSGVGPKKAAYAKKELMDATTTSTNAYAVYSTQLAAREAVKRLNGSIVLDRHLLVDSVSHPRKVDHRRCVFVGNLGFVDDESQTNAAQDDGTKTARKKKAPSDIEEGLWRQFGKAGSVESVRVVRDATTRVGKGFAYVQFKDEVAAEKALLFNDKKYPPLLPRVLRVTRARKVTNKAAKSSPHTSREMKQADNNAASAALIARYAPKMDPAKQSLSGRAGKLFGRAGAARVRQRAKPGGKPDGVTKSPEQMVFEGYRASRRPTKKQGKPRPRSIAFKAKGGSKAGLRV
ncbi:MAG: hypothetical protein Q9174_003471 [Haloplaca sp. 1 TL-2023]